MQLAAELFIFLKRVIVVFWKGSQGLSNGTNVTSQLANFNSLFTSIVYEGRTWQRCTVRGREGKKNPPHSERFNWSHEQTPRLRAKTFSWITTNLVIPETGPPKSGRGSEFAGIGIRLTTCRKERDWPIGTSKMSRDWRVVNIIRSFDKRLIVSLENSREDLYIQSLRDYR
jgi:hypothetical protein